eukprot:m.114299 g.114299  ORF g.114299 m.114299 type:complete len:64 (+) comp22923_c0_seq4:91-282(+)
MHEHTYNPQHTTTNPQHTEGFVVFLPQLRHQKIKNGGTSWLLCACAALSAPDSRGEVDRRTYH